MTSEIYEENKTKQNQLEVKSYSTKNYKDYLKKILEISWISLSSRNTSNTDWKINKSKNKIKNLLLNKKSENNNIDYLDYQNEITRWDMPTWIFKEEENEKTPIGI